jgi:hypothetical protein
MRLKTSARCLLSWVNFRSFEELFSLLFGLCEEQEFAILENIHVNQVHDPLILFAFEKCSLGFIRGFEINEPESRNNFLSINIQVSGFNQNTCDLAISREYFSELIFTSTILQTLDVDVGIELA